MTVVNGGVSWHSCRFASEPARREAWLGSSTGKNVAWVGIIRRLIGKKNGWTKKPPISRHLNGTKYAAKETAGMAVDQGDEWFQRVPKSKWEKIHEKKAAREM